MERFWREMEARKQRIDQALAGYLPQEEGQLAAGMRYAVGNGGKRLRPILVLEGFRLTGGDFAPAMPAACALELIHSYSLVHDDLPAMDNDLWRRGQATCHVAFGEANAILIGDALLTQAFAVLAGCWEEPGLEPRAWLRAIREIAVAAGAYGMVLGQALDMAAEVNPVSAAELAAIHAHKTGCLLTAALRSGAIMGGMDEAELELLTEFSRYLGMIFQIVDDILDVTGDSSLLGKAVGSDQKNQKTTYVSLYGVEGARRQAEEYAALALKTLARLGKDTYFLESMTKYMLFRSS